MRFMMLIKAAKDSEAGNAPELTTVLENILKPRREEKLR